MNTDRRAFVQALTVLGASALAQPTFAQPALAQPARLNRTNFGLEVARGAEARTRIAELYDPAYRRIGYPMGDVANDRGVCADTVIRAFRAAGIDLQQLVHEDMKRAFAAYPRIWGLSRPDPNIDHRRVPNLETFFSRAGASLGRTVSAQDCEPGDVISWRIPVPHIGVVSTVPADPASGRAMIAHNVGAGSRLEDVLFAWPIQGWFRYRPA